jgi:hypothetical protein
MAGHSRGRPAKEAVIPAHAGTQYAAASRSIAGVSLEYWVARS